jgi:hypothetical protein
VGRVVQRIRGGRRIGIQGRFYGAPLRTETSAGLALGGVPGAVSITLNLIRSDQQLITLCQNITLLVPPLVMFLSARLQLQHAADF